MLKFLFVVIYLILVNYFIFKQNLISPQGLEQILEAGLLTLLKFLV